MSQKTAVKSFAILLYGFLSSACAGSGDPAPTPPPGRAPNGPVKPGQVSALEIEPYRELCRAQAASLCYLVRRDGAEQLEKVAGPIEGFRHVWGVRARIRAQAVEPLAPREQRWRQIESMSESQASAAEALFVRLSVAVVRETEPCVFQVRSEASLHAPGGATCRDVRDWLRAGRDFISELEVDFHEARPLRILSVSVADGEHVGHMVRRSPDE